MQISDHFSLRELTYSSTAVRLGIDNTPSPAVIANLTALCLHVLEPVRARFGLVRTSSGYRCSQLNTAIGGSDSSQHVSGKATDYEVPGVSNREVAEFVRRNLKFDQLILEGYVEGDPNAGWIHTSFDEHRLRSMFGIWHPGQGYTWGTLGK